MPRASLVILSGHAREFGLPLEGVAIILGVDELMDMARTTVNVCGDLCATAFVAKTERLWNASMIPSRWPFRTA